METPFSQPRCLLLTLGVPAPAGSGLFSGRTDEQFRTWVRQFPELALLTELVPKVAATQYETSSLESWERAAKIIQDHRDEVDGVVIFHAGEHLVAGAVVLDLLLHTLNMPVVMTTPGDGRSPDGWRTNLVIALQAIVSTLPGVSLLDGNRIVRASDAELTSGLLAGASAAKFDFGLRRVVQGKRAAWTNPRYELERQMRVWTYVPGLVLPGQLMSRAILLRVASSSKEDWQVLARWTATVPTGSHIIFQSPQAPPKKMLAQCGWLKDSNDEVAIGQAMWAFAQGSRWQEAATFARERRTV